MKTIDRHRVDRQSEHRIRPIACVIMTYIIIAQAINRRAPRVYVYIRVKFFLAVTEITSNDYDDLTWFGFVFHKITAGCPFPFSVRFLLLMDFTAVTAMRLNFMIRLRRYILCLPNLS